MNAPTKVTENGQVTLPQEVLDQLGIGPGSEVTFSRAINGRVTMERVVATLPPTTQLDPDRFRKLRGHAGPGLTTDEMMVLLRGEPE